MAAESQACALPPVSNLNEASPAYELQEDLRCSSSSTMMAARAADMPNARTTTVLRDEFYTRVNQRLEYFRHRLRATAERPILGFQSRNCWL